MANDYYQAIYNGERPPVKVLYYTGRTITDITQICAGITVSGEVAQAFRKASLDLMNTENGMTQRIDINLSHEIRIMVGNAEVFRGMLEVYNVDDSGSANAVAYDYNYFLTQNKDSEKFVGLKASQIIRQLCAKYGIVVGTLADTGYVIPKMILREKTIYEMMVIALTETEKKNGRKFALVNRWGKLYLVERKKEIKRVVLENKRTLLSASYAKSNENRRTQVKLVANEEKKAIAGIAKNAASIRSYGVRQHYEIVSEPTTQAKLNTMARELLEKYDKTEEQFSIEALGLYDVISSTAIVVNDRMSNMYGAFYVDQDTHTWDGNGLHTMSLKLTRTLDIPRIEYEEPQLPSAKKTPTGGGMPDVKYTAGYIGTAYDPKLGGINGSGDYSTTATGTKWAYGRTIAIAPKIIPYGSVVAIRVPGLPQYNGIYLAEDTGGAIRNENGGKRVDVLIKGKSATSKFGRRPIEVAILERGKGPADARAKAKNWAAVKAKFLTGPSTSGGGMPSSKAQAVVEGARKFKGRLTYGFGANNIPGGRGDCSAYTQYVFKKYAGIAIGRDTLTQIKKGRAVSKAQAQPGDLIFFANTYRKGVSHVGIVTGPGRFINLGSSGCYETSYLTDKYWAPKVHSFRRIL